MSAGLSPLSLASRHIIMVRIREGIRTHLHPNSQRASPPACEALSPLTAFRLTFAFTVIADTARWFFKANLRHATIAGSPFTCVTT